MDKLKQLFSRINTQTVVIALLTFVLGWQLGHKDLITQWGGVGSSGTQLSGQVPQNARQLDFKLFWDVWTLLNREYFDKKAIDTQKMYYGAIQGMVSSLGDPYTVFLPPQQQKSTQEELGGSFEGVGIELGYDKDKRLSVIAPLEGTPAEKAGVKAGDVIVKIGDKDALSMSLPDAVSLIRGPKGSAVALEIFREGESAPRTITIYRDTIVVKSVVYKTTTTPKGKNIANIKLSRFGGRTNDEWNQAISQALKDNVVGVVLDMRNNPGGYLDDAVYITSEFISSGNVVEQENGKGEKRGYPVNRTGKMLSIPLVVLINKGSASASEIVAGAIQDNNRGKLIGDQSFGKGTIQESDDLPGGTGIHITTAKWLTPKGRWIHNTGLTPDIKVSLPTTPEATSSATPQDTQMDRALEELDNQ
jgi:carboxyl-terminal processing protease